MAFTYSIFPDRVFALIQFRECITGEDVFDAVRALFTDPDWQAGSNILWDCQGLRELVIDISDIDKLAVLSRDMASHAGPGKTAVVVTRDLDYSIAALIGARRQSTLREFKIFRSAPDAYTWLGVEEV